MSGSRKKSKSLASKASSLFDRARRSGLLGTKAQVSASTGRGALAPKKRRKRSK